MDDVYTAEYARLYREHWWWRVREGILLHKIREIRRGRSSARILDVGCGAGVFFDALEPFGDIQGIESDATAVQQSGRWRGCIHVGELDGTFAPGHRFDLILMLDVLEHLEDPERALRRAAELLTPDGGILVTVPAFDWLWTSHDDLNRHFKRYTASEMRMLLGRAGLTAIETRYLFQSLLLPKLAVRAKELVSSSPTGVPRVPVRLLNRTLQGWYRLEHAIAGRLPFGSSVMAVARLK
jgi:SAM-dependent methyltransferase